jgi:sulfhydrogenase subunit gamma (sulfur reductase)
MTETDWLLTEVIENREETPFLSNLKLTLVQEEVRFNFQSGQCVRMLSPSGHESIFAIANEPEEKRFLEFLLKDHEGSMAQELRTLQPGNKIKISLPFGKGYPLEQLKRKEVVLIGIGSGLSPLRSLLRSMLRREHQFEKIVLIYGVRTPEDLPYKSDFELWKKKVDLHLAMSQPGRSEWSGFVGRVTHLLPMLSLHPERTRACVCGTRAMQEEVTNLLERIGISKENILFNH